MQLVFSMQSEKIKTTYLNKEQVFSMQHVKHGTHSLVGNWLDCYSTTLTWKLIICFKRTESMVFEKANRNILILLNSN